MLMKDIDYTTISTALEVWDSARFHTKGSEAIIGKLTFERLFELEPEAKKVFGSGKGPQHAAVHEQAFPELFDSVFQLVGPDTDFIHGILTQVGKRHKAVGVRPSFLRPMGLALIQAIEKSRGTTLTEEERSAWQHVYDAISNEIIDAMRS